MQEVDQEVISRLHSLFEGWTGAHGVFIPTHTKPNGKQEGYKGWRKFQHDAQEWESHLLGQQALGVAMVRDDSTCLFGALDIDINPDPIDLEALGRRIHQQQLPLVVCRSKSGGAHAYVFLAEPLHARELRKYLKKWRIALKLPKQTEIFPKQDVREPYSGNESSYGCYIHVPYFGGEGTPSYCYYQGRKLSLKDFLDLAEASKVVLTPLRDDEYDPFPEEDPGAPRDFAPQDDVQGPFYEAPPCLRSLMNPKPGDVKGFGEGQRNDGMFAVGVYLRKRYGEEWTQYFEEYNSLCCDEPLPATELRTISTSVNRKDYGYKCSLPLLSDHCKKSACRKCLFGVGGYDPVAAGCEIERITRYDAGPGTDPDWGVWISGKEIKVTTDELMSPNAFNKRAVAVLNTFPVRDNPDRWQKRVNARLKDAEIVEVDRELTDVGQVYSAIQSFINLSHSSHRTQHIDNMAGEVAYIDYANGVACFRAQDVLKYMQVNNVKPKSLADVRRVLMSMGGTTTRGQVSNRTMRYWMVPFHENELPPDRPIVETKAAGESF